jgi:hypothetical protein
MHHAAHIILNIGAGSTMAAIMSNIIKTQNGTKYFLALSHDFFKPLLVVATPRSFAFLMPKYRSSVIAISIAAAQMIRSIIVL